jgi:hypothetical protein
MSGFDLDVLIYFTVKESVKIRILIACYEERNGNEYCSNYNSGNEFPCY